MTEFLKYLKILSLITLAILSGCIPNSLIETPTSLPQATTTNLPSLKHQLTYVMPFKEDGIEYQGLFAMDVQCLDKAIPCFGSPQLLLSIPMQSDTNSLNPYGEISSYSWSPSGLKIAFSAVGKGERSDIFVADWNGDNLKNITMSPESERSPSWSTDNRLVYTFCSGRCHAVIASENGTDATVFPFDSAVGFAAWMPDGENILFIGADDKSVYQIYTANVNGSDIKQITQTVENNIVEDASTNGKLIFFTRSQTYLNNNFNTNIFSIDIDAKVENSITADIELLSGSPSISLFSDLLAFEQGRGAYDIYVSSLDGTQIVQVTSGAGDKRAPEWRIIVNP